MECWKKCPGFDLHILDSPLASACRVVSSSQPSMSSKPELTMRLTVWLGWAFTRRTAFSPDGLFLIHNFGITVGVRLGSESG